MYLRVYRTVPAASLRADDPIDLGDGKVLVVDEVHLKRGAVVDVGAVPLKSDHGRRSWVTFKASDEVKVLADEADVNGALQAIADAFGYATQEWEDRHSSEDGEVPAPPWSAKADQLDVRVGGYWFTLAPADPGGETDAAQLVAEDDAGDPFPGTTETDGT